MLAHILPSSAAVIVLLAGCFVLVLAFEATNGFHDTSNAVATVIYTNTLKPVPAVVWSGIMNFAGVLVGGIAVAYALVEILPPDVLTPPDGAPALPMLIALFVSALFWNVLTWGFGIPNSSSHCIIGALIGVACGDAIMRHRPLAQGGRLAADPDGPGGPGTLTGARAGPRRGSLRAAPACRPPRPSVRAAGRRPAARLVAARAAGADLHRRQLFHGTNDGQKSIGLIMLTIIGLLPATFALNPHSGAALQALPAEARAAIPLIQHYGDDRRQDGVDAAQALESFKPSEATWTVTQAPDAVKARTERRGDVYSVISQLRHVGENPAASKADKAKAGALRKQMGPPVQFAPIWVRVLSAFCLGAGTMIGYKRVVRTLGERLGKSHMTPGQGGQCRTGGLDPDRSRGFQRGCRSARPMS